MVKVIFLTAPFKVRMMEKMVENFSSSIEQRIIVPSYPYTKLTGTASTHQKIRLKIFGENDLTKAIFDFKPDLIYSDTPLHAAQLKLQLLASRKSIPFIIHLRGDWWREYYSWFASATWRRRILSSQQYCYNWFSLITSTEITPICKWLESVVNHHIPWKPTEVVYQGVDPAQFGEVHEKYEFETPAIAIIQNHTIYPKVAGLLRLVPVIQKLPSVHFYITEGEKYDQRYAPLVKHSMADCRNVHFVKDIDNPKAVRKMLNSADCYLLATELDCCPTTVLEASLMQKPVIASRVGGVSEIILENQTGWTIPNDSTADWINKITLVLGDRKRRDSLGSTGRRWVSEKFGWSNIAAQVENLILKQSET